MVKFVCKETEVVPKYVFVRESFRNVNVLLEYSGQCLCKNEAVLHARDIRFHLREIVIQ